MPVDETRGKAARKVVRVAPGGVFIDRILSDQEKKRKKKALKQATKTVQKRKRKALQLTKRG